MRGSFFLHQAAVLLLLLPLLLLVQTAADADGTLAAAGSCVVTLTTANFQENVEDGHTWLVDFYAPWYEDPPSSFSQLLFLMTPLYFLHNFRCGHCVKLNPILDEVAAAVGDSLRIGKVRTRSLLPFLPSLPPSFKLMPSEHTSTRGRPRHPL